VIINLFRRYFRKKKLGHVFYVGGTDMLPPPLTQEEETMLLASLTKGNVDVRSTLIEHNLRLVVYIAKKYEASGVYLEDLVSIGTIGLIKAVTTYNTAKSTHLATYASRCIENATLSQMSFWLRKELPIGKLPNILQKICI
jgi:RNA polymerase sporulation-specific sigma factor